MLKKIVSGITLCSFIFTSYISTGITHAIDTNNSSTPWTIEKASHLARKALYGATPEKVQELFNAGSSTAAVNILFPSIDGPNRNTYESQLNAISSDPDFNPDNANDMYNYYIAKKLLDPYEAKSKLFLLFEDIFSVNRDNRRDITYLDIEATHDLLYSHTLGNYKEMVKRNLFNNGDPGDYSLGKFLDLFDQTNPSRPNENYAREILQLFLMLEYIPTESEDNGNTRNYSEEDVAALAKILIGFESNENTHEVSFNNSINTNQTIEFLDGDLKKSDNFPFYDENTNTIDIQSLKNSRSGNNGLPDNTIDYIFSKREYPIAMFLADRFYRFYVAEHPSRQELDTIANEIIKNNFEIYPTVKWILANDIMYSSKSMNSIVYKNPIELTIGTALKLNLSNTDISNTNLRNLGWIPYFPGSIFGRDGFDDNESFYTAYTTTKWAGESSYLLKNFDIESFLAQAGSGTITNSDKLLDYLEAELLLGRKLTTEVRDGIKSFLATDENGSLLTFDINNSAFVNNYVRSATHFVLIQPEYVLQSGYDLERSSNESYDQFYGNNSKLIIIKSYGGNDWLHNIIPKNEYNEYLNNRGVGALSGTGLISLDQDYYINSSLAPFKSLYDSGELRIINRVGTPEHSRGHDSASRKMTSLNNIYDIEDDGIIGHFIKSENPTKTVVMGGNKPLSLRGGRYLNIGGDARYIINDSTSNKLKNHRINTIKNLYNLRTYPGHTKSTFINSITINDVAVNSVNNGGRSGAGYNMEQNFTFIESLFDSNVANLVVMRADGGYDTHRNQMNGLNTNLSRVAQRTSNYFNRVKNKQDVTIVIYSEFGRTLKLNESQGTDHGKGGGMYILTSNNNLKKDLKKKVYGNLSFNKSESNWLGVGIDYRSVYSQIIESLYGKDISRDLSGRYNIDTYSDNTPSQISLMRMNYLRGSSDTNTDVRIKFQVEDDNFFPTQASYLKFEYGTDPNDMYEFSQYYINRYMKIDKDSVNLRIQNLAQNSIYHYKITLYDNQYNEKIITGSFETPSINQTANNKVNDKKNTRFLRYNNTTASGSISLNLPEEQIVLSDTGSTILSSETGLRLMSQSGTVVNALNFSGSTIWNGTFILPTSLNTDDVFSEKSEYKNKKLKNISVKKLLKVGSDELGVGMQLNKPVTIEVDNLDRKKKYVILYSEDGIKWNKLENPQISFNGNTLSFNTPHFTLFAIAQDNGSGEPLEGNGGESAPETPSGNNKGGNSGGGVPKYKKDICPYGDYSISYYDKTCGIDPDGEIAMNMIDGNTYIEMNNIKAQTENNEITIENEKVIDIGLDEEIITTPLQLAELELKIKEPQKYKIYKKIFSGKQSGNDADKTEILKLLREGLSTQKVGAYDIVYIKNGKKNKAIRKIADYFIQKGYKQEHLDTLIKNLNTLVIYLSIKKLNSIDSEIKNIADGLFQDSAKDLIQSYKVAKGKKKISFKRVVKKSENRQNNTPTSNESISEKIRRINEKKRLKKLKKDK